MKTKRKSEFIKWMNAILIALRELGGSGTPQEVSDAIAEKFKIPDKQREELTASGVPRFHNQVCWARQYLVWEGYLESSKRGIWQLSSKGNKKTLTDDESRQIFLKWVDIHAQKRKSKVIDNTQVDQIIKDEEKVIDENIPKEQNYKEDFIQLLRSLSPRGFEELCLLLLRENGFENLKLTAKSHDGGIDGISTLRINPFVSFKVLFQCKRHKENNTISRAQVGDFRNAMIGRADKGIFITTGFFSVDAEREANREGAPPIELVDCNKLVDMFELSELGLIPIKTYEIDRNFFEKYKNI